jgi:hypothetical protein
VWFLIRFRFLNAGGGKIRYVLEVSSGFQGNPGTCVENTCSISVTTDPCSCGYGEFHGWNDTDLTTCRPDEYEFDSDHNRCCPDLLDYSEATAVVTVL